MNNKYFLFNENMGIKIHILNQILALKIIPTTRIGNNVYYKNDVLQSINIPFIQDLAIKYNCEYIAFIEQNIVIDKTHDNWTVDEFHKMLQSKKFNNKFEGLLK